jgi:hypothetical protein
MIKYERDTSPNHIIEAIIHFFPFSKFPSSEPAVIIKNPDRISAIVQIVPIKNVAPRNTSWTIFFAVFQSGLVTSSLIFSAW